MTQASDDYDALPRVIGFVSPSGNVRQDQQRVEECARLLLNAGELDGMSEGQRIVVFGLGPDIMDPATNESLGRFEAVRGEGRIVSVMPRMSVVECTETRQDRKVLKGSLRSPLDALSFHRQEPDIETITTHLPFRMPALGDLARTV